MRKTLHISDDVAVDVDDQGETVGVKFLLAPVELSSDVRKALFGRFPTVRNALSDLHALAVF